MNEQQSKRALQQTLLNDNCQHLQLASKQLQNSFERCSSIALDSEALEDNELERFEALTSRFARLADLLIQKAIRLIEVLELEGTGSILDRINQAEKRGLISSAEQFIEIQQLRNSIAHEYDTDALLNIFKDTLVYTPELLKAVENTLKYVEQKQLLAPRSS